MRSIANLRSERLLVIGGKTPNPNAIRAAKAVDIAEIALQLIVHSTLKFTPNPI
ncbi:hypothetical protein VCRA2127O299_150062 [Vibrio crassostreae]|nr:hypothetical protein VCRA2113O227_150064 [Vibrio crassostreae]CAK1781088.1 hypothetical protein VCRA2112O184_150064 [Vibrio crassostreae]CAK1924987.1 hypothetical protein VCRA2113O197_230004 [Vibrio crassostreae]CAK2635280.1 hypothetical protein VCRA2113O219_140062 [Vibrio crassostreae]CAK2704691.1 hypothetical protein VCRA2127O300_140064 [Vibrio crassostreae]